MTEKFISELKRFWSTDYFLFPVFGSFIVTVESMSSSKSEHLEGSERERKAEVQILHLHLHRMHAG